MTLLEKYLALADCYRRLKELREDLKKSEMEDALTSVSGAMYLVSREMLLLEEKGVHKERVG